MSVTKVIRYTTKPESADENERLIRAVFAELAERKPDGVRYSAFRLDDGVSFIHLVDLDEGPNPLASIKAFGDFQAGIDERCVQGPTPSDATVVGSYRLLPQGDAAP